jgi:hypothetical protein
VPGTTDPSTFSSFTSGANQFLGTPTGQLATYAGVGALGMYEANQANQEAAKLAGSLGTIGTPYTAAGSAQLGQLRGGPSMGGPMGTQTALSTQAATELGNVAVQYGTGNLTPAQNTQVQAYVRQQRAQVDSQLAGSGNLNSSARDAAYQQIDNNAAMLTQQLVQGNVQMAQGALQSVQQTFNSLLNQALASSGFGLQAQSEAVALQIQSNTQVSGQLQQLFSALATGLGTAWGGGKGGTAGAGGTGGNAVQNILSKLGGGGGNVTVGNYPQTWSANDPNNPSSQNPNTLLGQNYPAAPLGQPPLTASQLTDPTAGGSYWSNMQTPNFNITGGDTGTVSVGQPTDTGAVSFPDTGP